MTRMSQSNTKHPIVSRRRRHRRAERSHPPGGSRPAGDHLRAEPHGRRQDEPVDPGRLPLGHRALGHHHAPRLHGPFCRRRTPARRLCHPAARGAAHTLLLSRRAQAGRHLRPDSHGPADRGAGTAGCGWLPGLPGLRSHPAPHHGSGLHLRPSAHLAQLPARLAPGHGEGRTVVHHAPGHRPTCAVAPTAPTAGALCDLRGRQPLPGARHPQRHRPCGADRRRLVSPGRGLSTGGRDGAAG